MPAVLAPFGADVVREASEHLGLVVEEVTAVAARHGRVVEELAPELDGVLAAVSEVREVGEDFAGEFVEPGPPAVVAGMAGLEAVDGLELGALESAGGRDHEQVRVVVQLGKGGAEGAPDGDELLDGVLGGGDGLNLAPVIFVAIIVVFAFFVGIVIIALAVFALAFRVLPRLWSRDPGIRPWCFIGSRWRQPIEDVCLHVAFLGHRDTTL